MSWWPFQDEVKPAPNPMYYNERYIIWTLGFVVIMVIFSAGYLKRRKARNQRALLIVLEQEQVVNLPTPRRVIQSQEAIPLPPVRDNAASRTSVSRTIMDSPEAIPLQPVRDNTVPRVRSPYNLRSRKN